MRSRAVELGWSALIAMVIAACAFAPPLHAASSDVNVANAWVRPPAPGQRTASAYFDITSAADASLVAAASSAAARVEAHSMRIESGVMRMRAVERVELPAGRTVKFAPGGLHLMLFDLKQPIRAGDRVPLVLTVQPTRAAAGVSVTTVRVEAEVRAPPSAGHHN